MQVTEHISGGDTRCVQAAFRMVVQSLVGRDPGEEAADRMTGYVEGRGTWQFRMLLSFAELGLNAIDHEEFDVQQFIANPEASIRAQVADEDAIQGILAETDLEAEKNALLLCESSPNIKFIESVPSFENLAAELSRNRLVLCNVNRRVLDNKEGREGHVLILESMTEQSVTIHDPGPNGGLGISIPSDIFLRAWKSPSETMANLISVWKA